jgi:siroheme synthase-like protein
MLDGAQLRALVVGGGAVAVRKARALLDAGAQVRLVAPAVDDAALAGPWDDRLTIERRPYAAGDVSDALLVVAATDRREVNARVARDARALGRLVNVVDAPEEGNCATAATHRAGDLTVAVGAGGVPAVAARVRDLVAARLDARYAASLDLLAALRRRLLAAGEGEAWREASRELVGADFCAVVESGALAERVVGWEAARRTPWG